MYCLFLLLLLLLLLLFCFVFASPVQFTTINIYFSVVFKVGRGRIGKWKIQSARLVSHTRSLHVGETFRFLLFLFLRT